MKRVIYIIGIVFLCSTVLHAKKKEKGAALSHITVDGISSLLKNDTDSLLMLNAWATWCGPCMAEFHEFVELDSVYADKALRYVTLSVNQLRTEEVVKVVLKKQGSKGVNYIFEGQARTDIIGTLSPEWQGAVPFTLIIAPGGEILYKLQGRIVMEEIKNVIEEYFSQ